ncbi:MAG: anthranilate phosphoribosyltransferase [Synechococcus sp. MED-G71]|nr:MAG: anthranilate phosphoribosyltransferase [Synechococcus sp. MED-G71]
MTSTDTFSWPVLLEQLCCGEVLQADQAKALMQAWLDGALEPVQTGAFLAALRCRPYQAVELAAMAQVLREASALPCPRPAMALVDTCGTGGDGADSFNISTAVAFTAAACGVVVAKHGNRSASGKVGSADVLEGLGVQLGAPLERVVAALEQTGVSFLFAPGWHPALKGLAPLRRSLGVRTVFNLLGPLVNPLQPEAQVLGVATPALLEPMAGALQLLSLERAVVVHGHGGLDEASLSGPSQLVVLENGCLRHASLDPVALGLSPAPLQALSGGDLQCNQQILEAVLQGEGTEAQQQVVALNTALVLWSAGAVNSWSDGVQQALSALASGSPWQRLQQLSGALASAEG